MKLRLRSFIESEETLEIPDGIPSEDHLFVAGRADQYFESGRSALECIRVAMVAAGKETASHVLDFASGYGRQTRVLRAAFPSASITACDIDRDAVDYCAREFGATSAYSVDDPTKIEIDGMFDLIWCGSLLTHVDFERRAQFLSLFESLLAPKGLLVFTTVGRRGAELIRTGGYHQGLKPEEQRQMLEGYDQDGFAYVEVSYWRTPGINGNYGAAFSSPAVTCAQVEKHQGLRIVSYVEAGWHAYNDVIGCVRVAGSTTP